jgi:hypothetical protein
MSRNTVRKHPTKTTGEGTRLATGAAQPAAVAKLPAREVQPIAVASTKAPEKTVSQEKGVVSNDKSPSVKSPAVSVHPLYLMAIGINLVVPQGCAPSYDKHLCPGTGLRHHSP